MADCNDDICLSSFQPSTVSWAGSQRCGLSPEITEAANYSDLMARDDKAEFPPDPPPPIPQPPEISNSLEWITSTNPSEIVEFWDFQLTRLRSLVSDCEETQCRRDTLAPSELTHLGRRFNDVAFRQLLPHFSLGGDRWISQYVFGFPTTGIFSHQGIFPSS